MPVLARIRSAWLRRSKPISRASQVLESTPPSYDSGALVLEQHTIRTTISCLPEDIIIEILCSSMAPRDLVAVGQTCRALRRCSSVRAVWVTACLRDPSLPRISPPKLVLPASMERTDYADDNKLSTNLLPKVDRIEVLKISKHALVPALPAREADSGSFNYRTRYVQIMQRRQRMCNSPVVCEHLIAPGVIPAMSHRQFMGTTVSSSGHIVILWQQECFYIIDLRCGEKYEVPLKSNRTISNENPIVAELFEYEGNEGVVLVASF
ncbi:hypothetical protein DL93DRAFT_2157796 [Clavulina sp. PMI_390]|nr:hypothetical protein DL93DRAFT_2157796 [Clavulina sp. PMI_390]